MYWMYMSGTYSGMGYDMGDVAAEEKKETETETETEAEKEEKTEL